MYIQLFLNNQLQLAQRALRVLVSNTKSNASKQIKQPITNLLRKNQWKSSFYADLGCHCSWPITSDFFIWGEYFISALCKLSITLTTSVHIWIESFCKYSKLLIFSRKYFFEWKMSSGSQCSSPCYPISQARVLGKTDGPLPEQWTLVKEWNMERRQPFESWRSLANSQILHMNDEFARSLQRYPNALQK